MNDSKTEEAIQRLDALDVSDRAEARIEAEAILLSLVPDAVTEAYGRYVRREEAAHE